jgi:hypothetical protein
LRLFDRCFYEDEITFDELLEDDEDDEKVLDGVRD